MRELSKQEMDIISALDKPNREKIKARIAIEPDLRIVRKSKAKNIVLRNSHGKAVVYNVKKHSFDQGASKCLTADEIADTALNEMKQKCSHVSDCKCVNKTDNTITLHFAMDIPYLEADDISFKIGKTTEKNVINKINSLNIAVTDSFINLLTPQAQNVLNEIMQKHDLTDEKLNEIFLLYEYLSAQMQNNFRLFYKPSCFTAKYNPLDDIITVASNSSGISFAVFTDSGNFTEGLKNQADKKAAFYTDLYAKRKEMHECIEYILKENGTKIVINSKFKIKAEFKNYGSYTFDPSVAYKRKWKAWKKAKEDEQSQKLKEKEKMLKSNPCFGKIIPHELLLIIASSDNDLTKPASLKIMRGLQVNNYYGNVDYLFGKHCSSTYRYNAVTEEELSKQFELLFSEGFISERRIKGEYGKFYVYRITEKGKDYIESMKSFKKSEYNELQKIIDKTDMSDWKSCLKTAIAMTDKPEYACTYMIKYLRICMTCYDRIIAYIDAVSSISDDGIKCKSFKKLKKIINDEQKEKTNILAGQN